MHTATHMHIHILHTPNTNTTLIHKPPTQPHHTHISLSLCTLCFSEQCLDGFIDYILKYLLAASFSQVSAASRWPIYNVEESFRSTVQSHPTVLERDDHMRAAQEKLYIGPTVRRASNCRHLHKGVSIRR